MRTHSHRQERGAIPTNGPAATGKGEQNKKKKKETVAGPYGHMRRASLFVCLLFLFFFFLFSQAHTLAGPCSGADKWGRATTIRRGAAAKRHGDAAAKTRHARLRGPRRHARR